MPPKKASSTAAKPAGTRKPKKSIEPTKVLVTKGKPSPAKNTRTVERANNLRKRKAVDDDNKENSPTVKKTKSQPKTIPPPKKAAAAQKQAPALATKREKDLPIINKHPTEVLDIYVFGEGSAGELGLGAGLEKDVMNVKRPRLNQRLEAKSVGVVHVAVGGMHNAALTYDNKILTWGVNDQGALGRETDEGPLVDVAASEEADDDSGSDSDSDSDLKAATAKAKAKAAKRDSGLNASEAEPREVDSSHFPEGTKFAQLVASDSATFALTSTGIVYGWGTFRGTDGILGFRHQGPRTQNTPILIPELENITSLAAGTNHVLALNNKGKVFAWGAGEQNQLGRRLVVRTATGALVPREFGLGRKRIVHIGCGDYHSYAVDDSGNVYAWGLNSLGQCGSPPSDEVSATVPTPTLIDNLRGFDIQQIVGGARHTLALTKDGTVLVWGGVGNMQGGVDLATLSPDSYFKTKDGRILYLKKPVVVPGLDGVCIATGPDTCAVISKDGKAYTWGFNVNFQAGQGQVDEIPIAQWVDNTAVRGKKLVFAGIGGQFGVFGGIAADD